MEKIRSEYVVSIEGNLRARKDPNKKIPTGMVELEADAVTILNAVTSKLPFLPAEDTTQLSEEVRLKHRVLDLRYTLCNTLHDFCLVDGHAQQLETSQQQPLSESHSGRAHSEHKS